MSNVIITPDPAAVFNVGRVTSYADAVKGGYQGTREEWERDLANLGTTAAEVEANRQAVAEDKAAVQEDLTTVESYKNSAAQSASEALQSAESAHTDALAATAAKEAAQTAQGIAEEARADAVSAKGAAESAQTEANASASAAAESALAAQNAAETATANAGAASDSATAAAASAASVSGVVAEVTTAKSEALAAIETKGAETLDSIPDDYTELSGNVDDLKSALLTAFQPEYGDGYSVFINGSNKWSTSHSPNSKIIPIPEGVLQIDVTANSVYNAVIAFLKTNDYVPDTLANYAEGTGRITINADTAQSFSIPDDASYLYVLNIYDGEIRLPESVLFTYFAKAEDTQRLAEANEQVLDMITKTNTITAGTLSVVNKYIDVGNARIGSATVEPARLLIIPSENFSAIRISIPLASTKRIAFCESLDLSAAVYNVAEIADSLDKTYKTNGHAYCVVQLFTNNDTEQNYEAYIADTVIESIEAPDYYARNEISKITDRRFFHAENLTGLPILSSFSDIDIVTSAYNDSAAFHALVGTLCEGSNGYITQTLIGNDGHGNDLYKYETVPKSLKYGVARREGSPIIPVQGGKTIDGLTCLITSNIHGREKNGNWVVYNLLAKLLNSDSDMLRFIRNRVKIVWVPFICASGDYENADGININRDFPTTIDGTCTSLEATAVKNVIDEYGDQLFLHIDIHTFNASAGYSSVVSGWIFTDSEKFAERTVLSATDAMNQYHAKYPSISRFGLDFIGSTNIATTCTYYTQTVYGVPSATIEGVLTMDGSPEGSDAHTSAVAYLYDVITHALCSMVD